MAEMSQALTEMRAEMAKAEQARESRDAKLKEEFASAVAAGLEEFEQGEAPPADGKKKPKQRPVLVRKTQRIRSSSEPPVLSDSGCTWTVEPESNKPADKRGLTRVDAEGAFGAEHTVDGDAVLERLYAGSEHLFADRQGVIARWTKLCTVVEGGNCPDEEVWVWAKLSPKARRKLVEVARSEAEDRVEMSVERGVPEMKLSEYHRIVGDWESARAGPTSARRSSG